MRRANLQVKFGLSYILVIAAVLVFMNTYPLIVSENLVVRSKQTTLQSSVSVMVTALSGLEELSEENVASAMTLVEDTGISRILVTDAAGRILYDTRETDGAEKMQYMAEDPADLLPVLTGNIRFDLTWLSENYKAVSLDEQAFIIRDEDGGFVSEYFWAAYGANDGKGWFRLEIMHDTTWNLSPDYIVDGTFEEAYYYTTASGYEFLITADGDTVWADCTTAKTSVSLYGAYLTTRDLEQIVEHLSVSIAE